MEYSMWDRIKEGLSSNADNDTKYPISVIIGLLGGFFLKDFAGGGVGGFAVMAGISSVVGLGAYGVGKGIFKPDEPLLPDEPTMVAQANAQQQLLEKQAGIGQEQGLNYDSGLPSTQTNVADRQV